jgi:hypothetical protein
MAVFRIPVIYQMAGYVSVEADTLADAENVALDKPLPLDAEYVNDSFELDIYNEDYPTDSTEPVEIELQEVDGHLVCGSKK